MLFSSGFFFYFNFPVINSQLVACACPRAFTGKLFAQGALFGHGFTVE